MQFFLQPDYIIACAGAVYMLALLIINQIALRCLLLVGSLFYITYYSIAADQPLWAAIVTESGVLLANLVGLALLFFRNSRFAVPRAHADIYPVFSLLPPGDFRDLIRLADRRVLAEDAVLTRENQPVETLYFVLDGQAIAEKRGQSFPLPERIFIGEVGYMTGNGATATIAVPAGSEILAWDVSQLRRKGRASARFNLALDAIISKDLAAKVAAAGAPSNPMPLPV